MIEEIKNKSLIVGKEASKVDKLNLEPEQEENSPKENLNNVRQYLTLIIKLIIRETI